MKVHALKRRAYPSSLLPCLERLTDAAADGTLTGLAFVGFIDGHAFIADTCGEASIDVESTRKMLRRLDAKLAKRQLNGRR